MTYKHRSMHCAASAALALVAVSLICTTALATPVTYSFSSGSRSATAEFDTSGSNLVVKLTNTSTADALVPTDILTAVYFDIAGSPSLTRVSAMVPAPSEVYEIGTGTLQTPGDRVVGGEWAYLLPPGISSTGLGIFGPGQLFPGANLQGPASPDGVQFGITSATDNLLTGNGGLSGEWLIKNFAVFTLGGYSGNPNADISNVVFQYGTALDEPQFHGNVPEPSTMALALVAAASAVCYTRRPRRRR